MMTKHWLCALVIGALSFGVAAQSPAPQGSEDATAEDAAPQRQMPVLTQEQIAGIADPKALKQLMAVYRRSGDFQRLGWTLERLTAVLPNVGEYKFALAVVYANTGEKTKAYDLLMRMKSQGFGYDVGKDKRFEKIADTRVWEYVANNLKSNLQTFGEGKVAFELPKGDTLAESLGWDPKRKKFLVGSARDGSIQLVDDKGKTSDFIKADATNGLWSVYALAVDAERDLLYVASTSSVYFKGFKQDDFGKAGVFAFRLSTGKLVDRYLVEGGGVHTLSSITVGKGGQMFVADGVRNVIYTIEGKKLKVAVADPNLTSIRGLAVSDDGKLLYFADYQLGLFGVHLSSGTGFAVQFNPEVLVLGGIDGLYWYDGTLVTIASGMMPKRVMRLTLSQEGSAITKAMPLDAANPALSVPTYGTVADGKLYFVANSQKALYGQYGDVRDASKLESVKVFRSDLRFAWNETGVTTNALPVREASFEEGKKLIQERPSLDKDGTKPTEKKPGG